MVRSEPECGQPVLRVRFVRGIARGLALGKAQRGIQYRWKASGNCGSARELCRRMVSAVSAAALCVVPSAKPDGDPCRLRSVFVYAVLSDDLGSRDFTGHADCARRFFRCASCVSSVERLLLSVCPAIQNPSSNSSIGTSGDRDAVKIDMRCSRTGSDRFDLRFSRRPQSRSRHWRQRPLCLRGPVWVAAQACGRGESGDAPQTIAERGDSYQQQTVHRELL